MDTVGSFNGKDGIKSLERQIKRYVDDTVKFKGDKSAKTGYKLESKDIKRREVHIAIPQGTSQAKMQAIQNAINYGKTQNVNVVITVTGNE